LNSSIDAVCKNAIEVIFGIFCSLQKLAVFFKILLIFSVLEIRWKVPLEIPDKALTYKGNCEDFSSGISVDELKTWFSSKKAFSRNVP